MLEGLQDLLWAGRSGTSGSSWRIGAGVDTWWRRQIGRELREEQNMEAEKREIEEKTSMKFEKAERDVRYKYEKGLLAC